MSIVKEAAVQDCKTNSEWEPTIRGKPRTARRNALSMSLIRDNGSLKVLEQKSN